MNFLLSIEVFFSFPLDHFPTLFFFVEFASIIPPTQHHKQCHGNQSLMSSCQRTEIKPASQPEQSIVGLSNVRKAEPELDGARAFHRSLSPQGNTLVLPFTVMGQGNSL